MHDITDAPAPSAIQAILTPFNSNVLLARRRLYAAAVRSEWSPGHRWPEDIWRDFGRCVLEEAERRIVTEDQWLREAMERARRAELKAWKTRRVVRHAAVMGSLAEAGELAFDGERGAC